jgi:regulation of enolase protein 1 (concanavalin A-like superfamily)
LIGQDVGQPGVAGSYAASGGTYTVTGGGADIWGRKDSFYFAARQLSGDADLICRVVSQEDTADWAKAGIMVRETMADNSSQAMVVAAPVGRVAFQRRSTTNGTTANSSVAGQVPVWLRLVRTGNLFVAYSSSDGVAWSEISRKSIIMASQVWVGLAVTSHNNSQTSQAVFDEVNFADQNVSTAGTPGYFPRKFETILGVNFQPAVGPSEEPYLPDSGATVADRGNGWTYGWNTDVSGRAGVTGFTNSALTNTHIGLPPGAQWSLEEVPAGRYRVTVAVGGPDRQTQNVINAEGEPVHGVTSLGTKKTSLASVVVTVVDGKLTLDNGSSADLATSLVFLEIDPEPTSSFVIEDGTSDVTQENGTWSVTTTGPGTTRRVAAGSSGSSYSFQPYVDAGYYEVELRWPGGSAFASAVPVEVSGADESQTILVDQTTDGSGWVSVGVHRFERGNTGAVVIGTDGASGLVTADAVRFRRTVNPDDAPVLAAGLIAWRKADFNGITCAQCHGAAGYDIAIFNFDQADLRRAAEPHLPEADADAIFAMLEMWRTQFPPEGGLHDIETFRPFQPTGVLLGEQYADSLQRDAVFADYLEDGGFLLFQGEITTLAQARAAVDQMKTLDVNSIPLGVPMNLWSHAVSRSGAQAGGRIDEWVASIGQQATPAGAAEWETAQDAYLTNPTDENFWDMYHRVEPLLVPDPHNARASTTKHWREMESRKFLSNLIFQHDEIQRALGRTDFFTSQIGDEGPFPNERGLGSEDQPIWDVGESARSAERTSYDQLPLRHDETFAKDPNITVSKNLIALSGEYVIEKLWAHEYRVHQVFVNAVHRAKRSLTLPYSARKGYYLGYYKYLFKRMGDDAQDFPGSAAQYKRFLANDLRAAYLVQTNDIQSGETIPSQSLLQHVNSAEDTREVLDWADPANEVINDLIIDDFVDAANGVGQ